jgi:hypothetical protein
MIKATIYEVNMKDLCIKSNIGVGDTVWWVHCSNKVYKGVVENIELCEGSGALFCIIHSPSFQLNHHPCVHYTNVYLTRIAAEDFAEYQKENPDDVVPMCMKCHYNSMINN